MIKELNIDNLRDLSLDTEKNIKLEECYQTLGGWSIIGKNFSILKVIKIDLREGYNHNLYLVMEKGNIQLWRNKK